jgi:medium-chain acyl-[acyl-carrier-protein] hydrolase
MNSFEISEDSPIIYSEDFTIRSYHTDLNRKLTIHKLCSFFQDIAGNHTVACRVGWDAMQEQQVFWVLSRMKIEVASYPEWWQKIKVSTWSTGTNGLFAYRNFKVKDEAGNILVKASTMWLMVNTETRRIVRPAEYMKDFPLCTDQVFESEPEKLPELSETIEFDPAIVTFTETDMNMHMNNVSYVERIINSFDLDFLVDHKVSAFEINFLKEAVTGENLKVCRQQISDNEFLCNIVRVPDGTEMVRTRMKWSHV